MQKRGQLTDRIKAKSLELLHYEMDQTELRFMSYFLYVMTNEQRIDPSKINQDERSILSKWRAAGHCEGGIINLGITREFWDILTEIVFLGYVDLS